MRYLPSRPDYYYGFSLIEMAVVLLIVSTLLGGLLISIGSTREVSNRRAAETQINEILEAIYGYAQANGRLPCPATATSNGAESRTGGADSNCSGAYGFVPAVTLGLVGSVDANTLYLDPWDSPYRYSVSAIANVDGWQYTSNAGLTSSTQTLSQLAVGADLRVCDSSICSNILANDLPAVVLSLGADWASFSSTNEVENSGEQTVAGYRMPNNQTFVSTTYIEDSFDDQLGWISPSLLITRLIAAGQLP